MKGDTIIASQPSDNSTDRVMEWLDYLGLSPKRINGLEDTNPPFKIEFGNHLAEQQLCNIWFRRPDIGRHALDVSSKHVKDEGAELSLRKAMVEDLATVKKAYWRGMKIGKSVGSAFHNAPDKLLQLSLAQQCGIAIPHTLITGNKQELLEFAERNKNGVIFKSVQDSFIVVKKEIPFSMFTEEISKAEIDQLPQHFYRTLFQEKLDKDYEIRAFFLKDRFFSMAIFSQKDKQTDVDFRKYNSSVPNRIAPYQLPKEIEKRILKLMKLLHLDNGSIDIVKTKDGKWVYLEVNPVGQFGMVSEPCNYNLEREIAKALIE